MRLTMTLLALAEAGIFELLWSEQILDGVERNLPNVGISRQIRICPTTAADRLTPVRL
jgi:hypothetical protein